MCTCPAVVGGSSVGGIVTCACPAVVGGSSAGRPVMCVCPAVVGGNSDGGIVMCACPGVADGAAGLPWRVTSRKASSGSRFCCHRIGRSSPGG